MTYHNVFHGNSPIADRPLNNKVKKSSDNHLLSRSPFSPPQYLRIECTAEEKHLTSNILSTPFTLNSLIQPIKFTLYDKLKPINYKSEIVIHNNPETNLHIKVLRVAFPNGGRSQSVNRSSYCYREQSSLNDLSSSKMLQDDKKTTKRRSLVLPWSSRSRSEVTLHQWIDNISNNEALMYDDDIVFFLKSGEFYVRI
ncbi:unnamed protein product [Didymodactylos carnosus]|uniref:Uncharacterized protein n=1 Tax=Didymodactylos carnosus TaxID=1234261 RepID=A0A813TA51_9BILA|nr:unnamed protein product [Didymodactylos carnosus]CAF0946067.1 unnamed protein product [Didymodactylos carnosus]CAF3591880.1 unnamed protein product [Didymodactylos carnosus]CAF3720698.1 unnamed protein product [Didymodactylos carnosus]